MSVEDKEALINFDNYESNVEKININDRDEIKKVISEISLDNYQKSQGLESLNELHKANGGALKNATLTEEQFVDLIQMLNKKDTRDGRSRIQYMSEYKISQHKNDDFKKWLLMEKDEEEKRYIKNSEVTI